MRSVVLSLVSESSTGPLKGLLELAPALLVAALAVSALLLASAGVLCGGPAGL